jgi:mannosyltransferase OCH1-like enzyme
VILKRFRRESTRAAKAPVDTSLFDRTNIPKQIHIIWIGGKTFPYEDNLATWRQHNPEYRVRLWTDKNLPPLRTQWVLNALAANPAMPIAARADIIRLELLTRYGGIYTDADSHCVKPLAPLIDGLTLFGMCGNKGNIQNATLGTTRGHPAYRIIRNGIEARYMRLAYLNRNTTTGYEIFDLFGTRYITPVLRSFPDYTQIDKDQLKGSREHICVEGQDKLENAYIVHTNDCSWKKRDGGDDRLFLTPAHPPTL